MFDGTPECTPTAFVAIYGTPGLGRQLLSFFTVFQKPYFDPDPLFLGGSWEGSGCRFCRYLRWSGSLWPHVGHAWKSHFVAIYGTQASHLPCLGRLGNHILSFFTVSVGTCAMLGKAWKLRVVVSSFSTVNGEGQC